MVLLDDAEYVRGLHGVMKDQARDLSMVLNVKDCDVGPHLGPFLIAIIDGWALKSDQGAIDPFAIGRHAATLLEMSRHKGFLDALKTGE